MLPTFQLAMLAPSLIAVIAVLVAILIAVVRKLTYYKREAMGIS